MELPGSSGGSGCARWSAWLHHLLSLSPRALPGDCLGDSPVPRAASRTSSSQGEQKSCCQPRAQGQAEVVALGLGSRSPSGTGMQPPLSHHCMNTSSLRTCIHSLQHTGFFGSYWRIIHAASLQSQLIIQSVKHVCAHNSALSH